MGMNGALGEPKPATIAAMLTDLSNVSEVLNGVPTIGTADSGAVQMVL